MGNRPPEKIDVEHGEVGDYWVHVQKHNKIKYIKIYEKKSYCEVCQCENEYWDASLRYFNHYPLLGKEKYMSIDTLKEYKKLESGDPFYEKYPKYIFYLKEEGKISSLYCKSVKTQSNVIGIYDNKL